MTTCLLTRKSNIDKIATVWKICYYLDQIILMFLDFTEMSTCCLHSKQAASEVCFGQVAFKLRPQQHSYSEYSGLEGFPGMLEDMNLQNNQISSLPT